MPCRSGARRPSAALGLLVVRDFVIAHAGHLDVRSRTDPAESGTTVRITLTI